MKRKIACIFFVACFFSSLPIRAEDITVFHWPQTAAERKLDDILAKDRQGDGDMLNYLIQYSRRDRSKDAAYTPLFTKGFVNAVAAFEEKLVVEQCGGHYTGEACGYEASYISCGQDPADQYLYKTQEENDKKAVIAVIWPPIKADSLKYKIVYHLFKQNDDWKLDGVSCWNGDAFNFTPDPDGK